jgi:hypothetical protein
MRALKILRIIQLLYISRVLYTVTVLTRCLIETLFKIRNLLALWLVLVLTLAFFGREMLSYKARLLDVGEETTIIAPDPADHHAVSPHSNYDTLGTSLSASMLLFYNEEWHISMYEFGRFTKLSFVFHVLAIFV